jgi:competence/damage-inducible protein CinA-like protein
MQAELISIGTELLLGEITDTNATTIARALREIGLDLIYKTTVGDNEQRIAQAIDIALNRVDIVITSGGLGPTVDDVTREAIARATGRPLEYHPALEEQIAARLNRFGIALGENNKRQAYVPQGAIPFENPVGTAPIFILETERGTIMTLPGVPREMKYLLENSLIPWLKRHMDAPAVIKSYTLRTAGIGESQIDARIGDLMTLSNPTVGLAAHTGQTDIRITAKASTSDEADKMIAPITEELRRRLGEWIYGTGDETIDEVVARLLSQQDISVASLEVGTHGKLGERLQAATHSKPNLLAHHLALDTTEDLTELLGPGLPTEPRALAEAVAQAIRRHYPATYGLAVIVRPEPANAGQKAIGTALAAANEEGCWSRYFSWINERTDAPLWATTHALALLRRVILKAEGIST